MNLTRRSVLAAGIASVGAAGCSGTDDGPARAAAKNGPEAAVRNLLAAIDAGNENRIDELTLEDNPEIEQQSVTVKMATVHSAERCATHYGEESTAVRERMNGYIQEEGFDNYAFVYVDAELATSGPYEGYVTVVKGSERWLVREW